MRLQLLHPVTRYPSPWDKVRKRVANRGRLPGDPIPVAVSCTSSGHLIWLTESQYAASSRRRNREHPCWAFGDVSELAYVATRTTSSYFAICSECEEVSFSIRDILSAVSQTQSTHIV